MDMKMNGLLTLAILLVAVLEAGGDAKATLSKSPMEPDQIAVYQVFLSSYTNGSKSRHLNLAIRTFPLRLMPALSNACLKGISIEAPQPNSIVHEFDSQTAFPSFITLVNPEQQGKKIQDNDPNNTMRKGKSVDEAVNEAFASGLLALSEVAFDTTHQYAVMSFSFRCGGLCGHGETIVFQKKGGQWERTSLHCGGWIS